MTREDLRSKKSVSFSHSLQHSHCPVSPHIVYSHEQINAKEVELTEARLNSERTMVQMMELTNEVNIKQDEARMCAHVDGSIGGGGGRGRWHALFSRAIFFSALILFELRCTGRSRNKWCGRRSWCGIVNLGNGQWQPSCLPCLLMMQSNSVE